MKKNGLSDLIDSKSKIHAEIQATCACRSIGGGGVSVTLASALSSVGQCDTVCRAQVVDQLVYSGGTDKTVQIHDLCVSTAQCSARIFKRAFSARCSIIKKALTTVVSTFYQHFDDYFCDGHLFWENKNYFFCLVA